MKHATNFVNRVWTACLSLFVFLFIANGLYSQVIFNQTSTADFQGGYWDQVVVGSNQVSLPQMATSINPWVTNTVLPQTLTGHQVCTYRNAFVYSIGGNNGSSDLSTIYRASVTSTGNGAWSNVGSIPLPLRDAAVVVGTSKIYLIGGRSNGVPQSAIYYADIASDGSLGSWDSSSVSLPVSLWGHQAEYVNGSIYILGGTTGTLISDAVSSVYCLSLDANKHPVSISSTVSLPGNRVNFATSVWNQHLIVMGGEDDLGVKSAAVWYANSQANGQLSSWQALSSLPVAISHHSSTSSYNLLTCISGEYLDGGSPSLSNQVYYAMMGNFPSISWSQASNQLYDYTKNGQAYAGPGFIAYLGGENLSGTPTINSRYAPLGLSTSFLTQGNFISNPFYELGDLRQIQSLNFVLSQAANSEFYYRVAGADALWSDWVHSTTNPVTVNQEKQYIQYRIDLRGTTANSAVCSEVVLSIQGTQLSGNLNAMDTLHIEDSPFWATANISFTAGSHYIEPGVTILFSPNTGLEIGQASMQFAGTSEHPITLTYYSAEAGQWNGVYFTTQSDNGVSSSMHYVTIEKAGYGTNDANLRCVDTQEPLLSNCTLRLAEGHGLRLSNSPITIEESLLEDNTDAGIHLTNSNPNMIATTITGNGVAGIVYTDNVSNPNFAGVLVEDNLYGLYHPTPNMSISPLSGNITIENNIFNGHAIPGGTIESNVTWNNPSLDFFVLGTITIKKYYSLCRLTIEPGNTIRFSEGSRLHVGDVSNGYYPGELYAIGSADSLITFSSQSGQSGGWEGILFGAPSQAMSASSFMNYCIVEKANSYLLRTQDTQQPSIQNSIFRESAQHGVVCHQSMTPLAGLTFQNNAGYGLLFTAPKYIHTQLGALTFSGNAFDGVVTEGGTIDVSRNWPNTGNPYLILGDLVVSGYYDRYRLTIDPGLTLYFTPGSEMLVGSSNSYYCGEIYAVGTPDSLITFAPYNGQVGGWEGVTFESSTTSFSAVTYMEYCVIEKGNNHNLKSINTYYPEMNHCILRDGNDLGMSLSHYDQIIKNTLIQDNAGRAIYVNHPKNIPYQLDSLSLINNGTDALVCEGGLIDVDRTWPYFGADYHFLNTVTIRHYYDRCRLSIEPGCTLRFAAGSQLKVGESTNGYYSGEVYAAGTLESPIVFTAINDSLGGWDGIYFPSESNTFSAVSELIHCVVEKAADKNIECISTTNPTITNSLIRLAPHGIYASNSSPDILSSRISNNLTGIYLTGSSNPVFGNTPETGNDIFDNANYNVYNNTSQNIFANHTFWGHIDSVSISQHNFDYFDETSKGKVWVGPWVDLPQVNYDTITHLGMVTYGEDGTNLFYNSEVNLWGAADSATTQTDGQGAFVFEDLVRDSYKYNLVSNSANWGGVNATDALWVLRHFTHLDTLPDRMQTAADVNASKTVNGTDAMLIMQRYTQLINSFPAGDYLYYLADFSIGEDTFYQDLRFIWIGDVNGSYTPSGSKSLYLAESDKELLVEAGSEISVPVRISSPASLGAVSLQFSYPVHQLEWQSCQFGVENQPVVVNEENGSLRFAWTNTEPIDLEGDDVLLSLQFKVLPGTEGEPILLTLDANSELANSEAEVLYVDLEMPSLRYAWEVSVDEWNADGIASCVAYPNPTRDRLNFSFDLHQEGEVELAIYNALGQELVVQSLGKRVAGEHQAEVNLDHLSEGIYTYRLLLIHANESSYQTESFIICR